MSKTDASCDINFGCLAEVVQQPLKPSLYFKINTMNVQKDTFLKYFFICKL